MSPAEAGSFYAYASYMVNACAPPQGHLGPPAGGRSVISMRHPGRPAASCSAGLIHSTTPYGLPVARAAWAAAPCHAVIAYCDMRRVRSVACCQPANGGGAGEGVEVTLRARKEVRVVEEG